MEQKTERHKNGEIRNLIFEEGANSILNRYLVYEIGESRTLIFDFLCYKYDYWKSRNELNFEGFFFCTTNDIALITNYSTKKVERVVKDLIKLKLIEKKLKGNPAKNHYNIIADSELIKKFIQSGKDKFNKRAEKLRLYNIKNLDKLDF